MQLVMHSTAHLLLKVLLRQLLQGRLLGDLLRAVPDAQLQVQHEVVAAVALVYGLP